MRLQVYDKVLERVHKRIQIVASVDGGSTFTTFALPEVMIGQPLFNAPQCRSYVMTSLVKNGFRVKYTHPNFLMISWDHLRTQYEKATDVIVREQNELIGKHNQIIYEKTKEEQERTNREFMTQRQQLGMTPDTPAETRKLVRAAEDYIPSGKLRDVYFNQRN